MEKAQERAVLWFSEVARRALYRDLGHASLELYATRDVGSGGLGFSRNRYFQFLRLAQDLERLPRLRAAVENGELGWTKAQQVARVATPASEEAWIETASTVGRRELATEVKRARERAKRRRKAARVEAPRLELAGESPGALAADPPTTITLRLDGVQLARFEALLEQVRKSGSSLSREDVVLAGLASLVAEGGELHRRNSRKSLPGVQIVVRRCDTCEAATVVTREGDRRLDPAQTEALACDARVQAKGGPNRATIPPSVRAAVLARDGHRCTTQGCVETRFLEVHHRTPREQGGSNRPENLTTLCSRCHRFEHERGRAVVSSGGALREVPPIPA